MIEDRMFPALENLLSLTSKRQQVLAANVANLDTPGYRARDISFAGELDRNLDVSGRVFEVETKEKPNGNNVDLDRELTEITKNGLQYITLVQYLNQRIKTLRSAISEGGKG
jgi:flagellar basal-body rod protein FlgB